MRPDFYLGGLPVGHFLDAAPAAPGRYPYEPYRGEGHARFADALRQGHSVVCSFTRGWRTVRLVITGEECEAEVPECRWYVTVSEVWRRPRAAVLVLAWLAIGAVILGLRAYYGS
jgi:hypothetical protein